MNPQIAKLSAPLLHLLEVFWHQMLGGCVICLPPDLVIRVAEVEADFSHHVELSEEESSTRAERWLMVDVDVDWVHIF